MVWVPTNRIAAPPSALLREQSREWGPNANGVAWGISLPETVHERRSMSAEIATTLGAYCGQTPRILDERVAYGLSKELVEHGQDISQISRRV